MHPGLLAHNSERSRRRTTKSRAALRFSLSLLSLTPALCIGARAQAPAPTPAPLVSPDAAYNEALRPVEVTHRSVANWSDTETAALAVAVHQAAAACTQRTTSTFSGADLIALARLCALGQQWPAVLEAASRFIGAPVAAQIPPEPLQTAAPLQLAFAFSYQIEAALHLSDPDSALASSRAMLARVPYGALTQQSTAETAHYLQLIRTADAVALLTERQPLLLGRLRDPAALPTDLPVHELYAAGLVLPALDQFTNAISAASQSRATLDAALPPQLSADDAQPIAQARRQYAMLGQSLPAIPAAASLFSATETPRINTNYGSSTVLLLFPDWCAQCVRMGREFMPALYRLSEHNVHLYGLLAQEKPPAVAAETGNASAEKRSGNRSRPGRDFAAHNSAAAGAQTNPGEPKAAADLLRGTPTLVVSPQVLETFGATDFPLLIVTDRAGVVRFIQTAPENAFVAGGLVDQVTARIEETWPVHKASSISATAP